MGLLSLLRRWTSKKRHDNASLDPQAEKEFVAYYRRVAVEHHLACIYPITDGQIMEIRHRVIAAFRKGAKARKETLSERHGNLIAIKFLLLYEMLGEQAMSAHLKYEVRHYTRRGLRAEYNREPPMP